MKLNRAFIMRGTISNTHYRVTNVKTARDYLNGHLYIGINVEVVECVHGNSFNPAIENIRISYNVSKPENESACVDLSVTGIPNYLCDYEIEALSHYFAVIKERLDDIGNCFIYQCCLKRSSKSA